MIKYIRVASFFAVKCGSMLEFELNVCKRKKNERKNDDHKIARRRIDEKQRKGEVARTKIPFVEMKNQMMCLCLLSILLYGLCCCCFRLIDQARKRKKG